MKLYSIATSERASKAQGGNKYLKITLNIGSTADSRHVATMLANIVGDEVVLQYWVDEGKGLKEITERIVLSLKGNKQKGENRCIYDHDHYSAMSEPCEYHN